MATAVEKTASIKLVIWDLDDTFWRGTLTEGEIELIPENSAMVEALADRGIISSICSKNYFDDAKGALVEAGVWDLFVFPKIAFTAKAQAIEAIITQANLRPQNVLFIDDNPINLREAEFLIPGIMTSHPEEILPILLKIPATKGKYDRDRSRLKQYKHLELKVSDQGISLLSNEEFLKQCDIRVQFDFDIEKNIDRVIELVNRSNQLNYTKRRLTTKDEIARFREDLSRHDVFSGLIRGSDKYGDHGVIGFYMQFKNERANKLIHFVFSCRMMNVGLEQFVYEYLDEPEIKVVEPVSNPIKAFERVSWIKEGNSLEPASEDARDSPALLLIGSCDLTAVAAYCSRNRTEYVNAVENGVVVRYDDFGFVLGDAALIQQSTILPEIPCWTKADFRSFRADVQSSDVIIVSLSAAMKGAYLVTDDEVVVRIHPEGLGDYIDLHPGDDFLKRSRIFDLSNDKLSMLLSRALRQIELGASQAHTVIVLGANTRDITGRLSETDISLLRLHNRVVQHFCEGRKNWHYASVDEIVSIDKLADDRHYTRMGYFDIANFVNAKIAQDNAVPAPMQGHRPDDENFFLHDFIVSEKPLKRSSLLGHQRGYVAQIKRAIKLTPFEGVVRKLIDKKVVDPAAAWSD